MRSQLSAIGQIDELDYLDLSVGARLSQGAAIPLGSLLTTRGWIFAPDDLGRSTGVFAFVDDGPPVEIVRGIERPDVATALDDASAERSGFRGILSTSHLALGDHRLAIAIRDTDGNFSRMDHEASFSIHEPLERRVLRFSPQPVSTPVAVDGIAVGNQFVGEPIFATQGDLVTISGWAIDEPAHDIASAVFAIVGSAVFRADYAIARPDVAAQKQDDRFRHCGFRIEIPLDSIEPGTHIVHLRVVGIDGEKIYEGPRLSLTVGPFSLLGTDSRSDTPTLGRVDRTAIFDDGGHFVEAEGRLVLTRGQQLFLGGWAIDESSDSLARAVHVCVDGLTSTPAVYGTERRDVARHYHRPDLAQCGFTALLTTSAIPAGEHVATVRVIDRSGSHFYDIDSRIEFVVTDALDET